MHAHNLRMSFFQKSYFSKFTIISKYMQSPSGVHCISPSKMEKLQLINDKFFSLTKTLSRVMSHNRTLSSHKNFGVDRIY